MPIKRSAALLLCACMLLFSACRPSSVTTVAPATAAPAPSATPTATPDAVASSAAAVASAAPVSEDWAPTQPLTMIVAYKAGSSTDAGARLLAGYAERYVGQSIVIKNIASNSGMTAWETLAEAAPDGTTLGFINMPNIFSAIDNGGHFSMQNFAPVCGHLVETSVVVVADTSPYQSLEDLLAANRDANAAGTLLRVSTNGVQASNDIGASLLAYASGGWSFQHVAYGSSNDQMDAILSGECDWCVAKVSDVLPLMNGAAQPLNADTSAPDAEQSPTAALAAAEPTLAPENADTNAESAASATGVRVLAVFDTQRNADLPDVPTLDELGYPTGWYGSTRAIVAPAGTDPIIVNYYANAFRQAMADPACVAAHKEQSLALSYLDPAQLAIRIDDRERFNSSLLPKLFR